MRDELGPDIPTGGKGCWLNSRLFDDEELQLLVDTVLSSSIIGEEKKNSLVDKLCSLSSINFGYQVAQRWREQLKKQARIRFWQRSESDEPYSCSGFTRILLIALFDAYRKSESGKSGAGWDKFVSSGVVLCRIGCYTGNGDGI